MGAASSNQQANDERDKGSYLKSLMMRREEQVDLRDSTSSREAG
jgi:hypothetical protein